MDLGHYVFAVHDDGGALRGAQGHVQYGAVFRDVDFFAAEHGVRLRSTRIPGQLHEQLERLVGDAVLGVIQVKTGTFCSKTLARWNRRQIAAARRALDFLLMRFKCLPGLCFCGSWRIAHIHSFPLGSFEALGLRIDGVQKVLPRGVK